MQRPGFMTRAGFLSSYSHYDMTAPDPARRVHHDLHDRRQPGPAAPRRVTMIQPPAGNVLDGAREDRRAGESVVELHGLPHRTSSTRPATCMENYDAIGAWQTVDKLGNGAINPVADVNFGDGNIKKITTPRS